MCTKFNLVSSVASVLASETSGIWFCLSESITGQVHTSEWHHRQLAGIAVRHSRYCTADGRSFCGMQISRHQRIVLIIFGRIGWCAKAIIYSIIGGLCCKSSVEGRQGTASASPQVHPSFSCSYHGVYKDTCVVYTCCADQMSTAVLITSASFSSMRQCRARSMDWLKHFLQAMTHLLSISIFAS